MTTTEHFGGYVPPSPPPAPAGDGRPQRTLRRSRTDRVGAGVAGGLGEYFAVDPVLFRVLFATASFFGGAGVLAYLVAWVAIPEAGTVNAPIDRFVAELRRRRVPVWLVAIAGGLFLWAIAFSWWAPGRFFPLLVVVVVLVGVFGRRSRRDADGVSPSGATTPAQPAATDLTVSLSKDADAPVADGPVGPGAFPASSTPSWVVEARKWRAEAKAASRARRRRTLPIRLAVLGTLAVVISILAAVDAASGIAIPVYLWVVFGVSMLGLLAGIVLRRTPWTLVTLVVPAIIGLIAFGSTSASLHDGTGQREWTPTTASELQSHYRLAFGQGVLDLRNLGALPGDRTVHVTMAAGQVRLLLPPTFNATVLANVHAGDVVIDGDDTRRSGGFGVNRTVLPAAGATGAKLTIDVHLADGEISVEHS